MNALTPTTNFDAALSAAARAAADWLIADQKPDGHWVARADFNACMEAQWCLALWFLGLENHPLRPRLGAALLKTQRPDGAWQIYHEAPNGDINATVEAYAALRSLGHARQRAGADPRPRVDRVQGRLAQHPRLHPLLARPDRRMALGQDAEPAAGGDLVSALVPVQHL